MGLENFHPKRAIHLDGYNFISLLIPEYGVGNDVLNNFVMEKFLEQVVLSPWSPSNKNLVGDGFWLHVKQKNVSLNSPVFNILSQFGFSPSALLPSGVVIRDFRVNSFVSTFEYESGVQYVEMHNNNYVSLIPSLDKRFLKFYSLPEPKDYSDKVMDAILRDIARKLKVRSFKDGNEVVKVRRKQLTSLNVSA